jgi:hypothetical protein
MYSMVCSISWLITFSHGAARQPLLSIPPDWMSGAGIIVLVWVVRISVVTQHLGPIDPLQIYFISARSLVLREGEGDTTSSALCIPSFLYGLSSIPSPLVCDELQLRSPLPSPVLPVRLKVMTIDVKSHMCTLVHKRFGPKHRSHRNLLPPPCCPPLIQPMVSHPTVWLIYRQRGGAICFCPSETSRNELI